MRAPRRSEKCHHVCRFLQLILPTSFSSTEEHNLIYWNVYLQLSPLVHVDLKYTENSYHYAKLRSDVILRTKYSIDLLPSILINMEQKYAINNNPFELGLDVNNFEKREKCSRFANKLNVVVNFLGVTL